ncbi:MAG: heme o synthase [Sphingomonadales bacterium]
MVDVARLGSQSSAVRPVDDARVRDYVALLKPRVMSLVTFTGLVGLVIAPTEISPVIGFTALLCIALGAGSAGALNMWYEADIDAVMERTRNRPIPAGRIAPGQALGFGATLAIFSVIVMGLAVNLLSAALLALTIGFYLFVYTMWLKRRTPQNIVIGGVAGALPPVVAWAAATGEVSLAPMVLFAIILLWTPPHFWALALYRRGDYAKAGIPMLPVVAGDRATRKHILIYSLLLAPITPAPWYLGFAGPFYGVIAGILSVWLVAGSLRVFRATGDAEARRLFGFSIVFLFLIFSALLIERAVGLWGLHAA